MRRTATDLAVEREVEDDRGVRRRYRIVGRFELDGNEPPPAAEETARLIAALAAELDAAIPGRGGPTSPPRPDRPIGELIEAYHPRQAELVDLLLEEGEISPVESGRMREFLAARSSAASTSEPAGIPATERPIAAAPLAVDRAPSAARPVDELIRLYRIESLKQAGAVRGRRQISYEEYMALKRHFAATEPSAAGTSPPPAPP